MKKFFTLAFVLSILSSNAFGVCEYEVNDLDYHRKTVVKPMLRQLIVIEKGLTRNGYDRELCQRLSDISFDFRMILSDERMKVLETKRCIINNAEYFGLTAFKQLIANYDRFLDEQRNQEKIVRDLERNYCN